MTEINRTRSRKRARQAWKDEKVSVDLFANWGIGIDLGKSECGCHAMECVCKHKGQVHGCLNFVCLHLCSWRHVGGGGVHRSSGWSTKPGRQSSTLRYALFKYYLIRVKYFQLTVTAGSRTVWLGFMHLNSNVKHFSLWLNSVSCLHVEEKLFDLRCTSFFKTQPFCL